MDLEHQSIKYTYLIINANKNYLTPKYTYDVIKKGETRKAHPAVWQYPVAAGDLYIQVTLNVNYRILGLHGVVLIHL